MRWHTVKNLNTFSETQCLAAWLHTHPWPMKDIFVRWLKCFPMCQVVCAWGGWGGWGVGWGGVNRTMWCIAGNMCSNWWIFIHTPRPHRDNKQERESGWMPVWGGQNPEEKWGGKQPVSRATSPAFPSAAVWERGGRRVPPPALTPSPTFLSVLVGKT